MSRHTRRTACRESKDPLPAFESALQAMTDTRNLDPCTYDENAAANQAVLNDPRYMAFRSKADYDGGTTRR